MMTGLRASFWKRGEAAGRLDEAFPSCKTYSCVKEKERASEIAEWIRRILYNNIFV